MNDRRKACIHKDMHMKKKRKTNMKIHHKNMKQVSSDMQGWVQSNLSHLGVYEGVFCHIDLNEQTLMTIPTFYNWHCQYMEQDLDLEIASRLNVGTNYWNQSSRMFNSYKNFLGNADFYKADFVVKTNTGFELFAVASRNPFACKDYITINHYFRSLSYSASKIRKAQPNIGVDLRAYQQVKTRFMENNPLTQKAIDLPYAKSKFGDLILTAKEQQYVEYILFNLTHKEIAHKQDCSETAVRHVISNIKRKLGNEFMPSSHMLAALKEKGVLEVCAKSIYLAH